MKSKAYWMSVIRELERILKLSPERLMREWGARHAMVLIELRRSKEMMFAAAA